jgi:hypothetical protein
MPVQEITTIKYVNDQDGTVDGLRQFINIYIAKIDSSMYNEKNQCFNVQLEDKESGFEKWNSDDIKKTLISVLSEDPEDAKLITPESVICY